MEELKKLRKEVTDLMAQAKEAMNRPHSGAELDTRLSNQQRGKYIAYSHILSLIDDQINGKK